MRTQVRLAVFPRTDSVLAGRLGLVGAGPSGEALDTPFLLIGTVRGIAAQLRERRDRFGFSYITVHEPSMATLAPVIEQLR